MSADPSLYVLIALVPFVYMLDAEDMEPGALEKLIAEATEGKDTITETPAEMIALGIEHLVPLRDDLEKKSRDDLRTIIKDDYGAEGYSRSKKAECVRFIIHEELAADSRFTALEAERAATEAAAANRLKAIVAGAAEAAPKPAREPVVLREVADIPKAAAVEGWPPLYQVREIEVLKQFWVPTKAGKDGKTPSAAPVAKSLYRDGILKTVYNYALAREAAAPGWMKRHIRIVAVHG